MVKMGWKQFDTLDPSFKEEPARSTPSARPKIGESVERLSNSPTAYNT